MRDFRRKGQLRSLQVHSRLVYSSFLLFTLAGVALTLCLAHDMVGLRLGGFEEYYTGVSAMDQGSSEASVAQPDASDGPVLDLPEDLTQPAVANPMSTRKLLEVTHFHLFSMPVYLLILAHLYAMSTASTLSKYIWISAATFGTALHIPAPWLAAAGTTGASALYAVSGTLLALSYVVMCVVPLWEMWSPVAQTRSGPATVSHPAAAPSAAE